MKLEDISVCGRYQFVVGGTLKNCATSMDRPSIEFAAKYPTWGDVNGKTVEVVSIHGTIVKFCVEGDPVSCWASARASFFQPLPKTQIVRNKTGCHCNLWISGCICGVFQAEQQPNPPKKRKWKYIDGSDDLVIVF